MEAFDVSLRDGRRLAGFVGGADSDRALVFCHGTPFPFAPYSFLEDEAGKRNLRLIGWARPGYGLSDPQPGRTVASFAGDAREVLETVGIGQAIAAGWSGGGPHALSLGALLDNVCDAVITIGSVAPFEVDDLDWVAGMGPENVEEFALAQQGGAAFDAFLDEQLQGMASVNAQDLVSSMEGLISGVDRAALDECGLADFMAASLGVGVQGGPAGWKEDDEAFLSDWGFSVTDVTVPVSLWQGSQDLMVPRSHGEWLTTYLPNVTAHLLGDEGHLSLITRHLGAMLDEALALGGK